MALLLLAVALVSRDTDVSGLAIDALLQAIGDGRCTGQELGLILGRLLGDGLAKPNRLAKALETVARGSHLHIHVCAVMTQSALAALESFPKDMHHLLEGLLQWLVALQQPLCTKVRSKLETLKASGKTGSLAQKLLACSAPKNLATWHAILGEAAIGRIERARRWAANCSPDDETKAKSP